jgi:hypothetical protein
VLAFVHLILDDLHGTALTLDPEALSPPLLKRVIAKRDQFDHGIRTIIQQGIDQGVVQARRSEDDRVRDDGRGELDREVVRSGRPDDVQQIGDAFADYLVGGLRAR